MVAKTSCVAAGDIFITRRLPERRYEGFAGFRDLVLEHEVRFANLEILFLEGDEGYPADSVGTPAMGPPGFPALVVPKYVAVRPPAVIVPLVVIEGAAKQRKAV